MTGIFSPHPNPTLRVLSLGLGVQSTTMLFMAAAGEIGPMPDVAFFADDEPVPVKSRCTFCPFTHNAEWRRIKEEDPEQWADAVEIDRAIRSGGNLRGMTGAQFVHRSCVPLDEADLKAPDPRQSVMGELCEGMCGV